jgi:thiol-disulfide isomerase/thioredoxin
MNQVAPPSGPQDSLPPPATRRGLLRTAGLVAAAAGMGLAWWRLQAAQGINDPAPQGFWDMQLDTPQGTPLRMQSFQGKPLLLNFWATWCPPCIEELPSINNFFHKNSANGWQVIGLAVDRPDTVKGFLKKMPLDFPIALAALQGTELARSLGNPSGSLPFSVALGAQGQILARKLGRLRAEDLDAWARLK